jgi:hypothetical protein
LPNLQTISSTGTLVNYLLVTWKWLVNDR